MLKLGNWISSFFSICEFCIRQIFNSFLSTNFYRLCQQRVVYCFIAIFDHRKDLHHSSHLVHVYKLDESDQLTTYIRPDKISSFREGRVFGSNLIYALAIVPKPPSLPNGGFVVYARYPFNQRVVKVSNPYLHTLFLCLPHHISGFVVDLTIPPMFIGLYAECGDIVPLHVIRIFWSSLR